MDAIDRIHQRLKLMQVYVKKLSRFEHITLDELQSDEDRRAMIERYFQLACEVVLDIANLLNAEFRFRPAKDAAESIIILGEEGILDKEFARRFAGMAGFRNILVHDYVDIDYSKVTDNLNHRMGDFEAFAKAVATYLR
jgi:uncharacterized protein YutE (UPF0331/DUF86 family)